MKQKNYMVSIAISALNEEITIKEIIKDILAQRQSGWSLKELIVYCDGCTDKTADIVRSIKNPKIRIYEGKDKLGKVYRINQALSDFRGEVLVIFDADIKLEGRNVIANLINEFRKGDKVVLVGGNSRVYPPKTFFERAIYSSYIPYFEAREKLRGGNNVFGCTGACIALRRDFAKKVQIPSWVINEDTYFYFTCISMGYLFRHAKGAVVRYALAKNLRVFLRQIFRTHPEAVKVKYKKLFGNSIEEEYQRPFNFYIKSLWKVLKINPIGTLYMIAIKFFCLPFYSLITPRYNLKWYGRNSTLKKNGKKEIIISNYDSTKNPYYGGGGATAIHEIASRLTKEFKVTVITGKFPKSRNEIIDGVFYKRIGFSFAGPKLGQIIYQLLLPFYGLVKYYDLWIESFTPPFSTNFLQLFTKKPVIGLVHMLAGDDMRRKYKLPFHLIENLGLKTYKRFIVLSNDTKEKIHTVNKKAQVEIISNGVNLPKSVPKKEKKHILFIGRIEVNQKGLDLLLKAQNIVYRKTGVKLFLAGRGIAGEERKLRQLLSRFKLKDGIKCVGKVVGKRKRYVFENAYFTVISSRYETFSIVALESLSYGLPIVCFDIDGFKWLPRTVSQKASAFDERKFANAMVKMVKDTNLRNKMGERAKEFSRNYSWDGVSKKYLDFIYKVTGA